MWPFFIGGFPSVELLTFQLACCQTIVGANSQLYYRAAPLSETNEGQHMCVRQVCLLLSGPINTVASGTRQVLGASGRAGRGGRGHATIGRATKMSLSLHKQSEDSQRYSAPYSMPPQEIQG